MWIVLQLNYILYNDYQHNILALESTANKKLWKLEAHMAMAKVQCLID